ncbi:MAG: regulatory protein RecX [Candidatus Nanopelagicales bacterium]
MTEPAPGWPAGPQPDADPEPAARAIVLRRLAAAPRTRAELAGDLARRGVPADVIDRVLTRFAEAGLIDDAEYARLWVSSRHRSKGTARGSLRRELRRKGIEDDDAAEALAGIDDAVELERARALVAAKARPMTRLDPDVRSRRLFAMLCRRGYPAAVAASVVREARAQEGPESDSALEPGAQ